MLHEKHASDYSGLKRTNVYMHVGVCDSLDFMQDSYIVIGLMDG